jgi:hypothetical protein
MKPQRVTVTIDRLVLRGVAPAERDAITAGLAAELHAQFADPAAARPIESSRSIAQLRAAPIAAAASPQQTGVRAARALARSVRS